MQDLTQMNTFVVTAELGSLVAAARKLNISSAAISKQLTKLEEALGLQLMIRTTRKVELTDVGQNYCLQCRRILEEVEVAAALVSQVKAVPHGILKVVCSRHFGQTYIVPHVKEFLAKYSKIEFHLELAERIPDMHQEAIDVVIGMSISAPGDAIQRKIGSTSYTLCASPAYIKQYGKPKKVEELLKHRYISHGMRKQEDEYRYGGKVLSGMVPYISVNDTGTMLKFALDGLGIVKLHHYVVKEHLDRGALLQVLPELVTGEAPLYVAYPQRRFVASKVRCFIDFIVKKIEDRRDA